MLFFSVSGVVEGDALVMEGRGMGHGAVGAVRGVANPVLVAGALLADALAHQGPLQAPQYVFFEIKHVLRMKKTRI